MRAIGDLTASFWARRFQQTLLAILQGVFSSSDMAHATLDISEVPGEPEPPEGAKATKAKALKQPVANKISANSLLDSFQILGDAQHKITALAMHSVVLTQLKKLNLIDAIPDARGEIAFPTYLGRRIIVDDGCPVEEDNDGKKYTTYLFGAGAIAQGNGSPSVPAETGRDKRTSGGFDYLIHRYHFLLHPKGLSWKGDANPTNAQLASGGNWQRVYQEKNIPLARLVSRG